MTTQTEENNFIRLRNLWQTHTAGASPDLTFDDWFRYHGTHMQRQSHGVIAQHLQDHFVAPMATFCPPKRASYSSSAKECAARDCNGRALAAGDIIQTCGAAPCMYVVSDPRCVRALHGHTFLEVTTGGKETTPTLLLLDEGLYTRGAALLCLL